MLLLSTFQNIHRIDLVSNKILQAPTAFALASIRMLVAHFIKIADALIQ
jgi:hypothetical protein